MKRLISHLKTWMRRRHSVSDMAGADPVPVHNYVVCRETGVQKQILHRHIRQTLGLTPAQYRQKWGLPADYPLVSQGYRDRREAARRMK